ncbi:hypothetical protein Hypma_009915 [Hypsizygus marmoreus]|uniref:factor independent urate hydroxylase n=1 Tax=Hypsizygus marmoreus TaxID=39966 RepID=A0A369JTF9_HYPMA|nr:hypothetical protein Hypma_009915 [Hypsizygus marmoreus]
MTHHVSLLRRFINPSSIVLSSESDLVRLLRVVREGKWHHVVEYNVTALLEGDIDVSYTQADNSVIIATDSSSFFPALQGRTGKKIGVVGHLELMFIKMPRYSMGQRIGDTNEGSMNQRNNVLSAQRQPSETVTSRPRGVSISIFRYYLILIIVDFIWAWAIVRAEIVS